MCLRDSDGVNNLVKYLLFFFNFIFWIIGCILIGVGAWAYIEKNRFYHSEVESIYDILFDVAIGVILVGCIIFVIAFAGCLGALRENICLLKFFSYVLGILFLLEVIGAILIFVFSGQGKEEVTKLFREEGIVRYRDDPDFQSVFDWVQETFKCCGVGHKGYRDWSLNPYFNCSDTNYGAERCAVPYSCCIRPNNIDTGIINKMCGYGVQNLGTIDAADTVYVKGCVQAVIDTAEQNLYIVGGVALALAVPQIVGPLLGCYLAHVIKRKIHNKATHYSQKQYVPRKTSNILVPLVTHGKPIERPGFRVIKNFSWIPWVAAAFTKAALKEKQKPAARPIHTSMSLKIGQKRGGNGYINKKKRGSPVMVSMNKSQVLKFNVANLNQGAVFVPHMAATGPSHEPIDVPYVEAENLRPVDVPPLAAPGPRHEFTDVPYIEAELLPRDETQNMYPAPKSGLNIPRPQYGSAFDVRAGESLYPNIPNGEEGRDFDHKKLIQSLSGNASRRHLLPPSRPEPYADYDFDNNSDSDFPTVSISRPRIPREVPSFADNATEPRVYYGTDNPGVMYSRSYPGAKILFPERLVRSPPPPYVIESPARPLPFVPLRKEAIPIYGGRGFIPRLLESPWRRPTYFRGPFHYI